jgi:hypothetical protein
MPAFDDFEHDELDVRVKVSQAADMFVELFQLLFYEALAQASRALVETDEFQALDTRRPFHFFAQRHERWPVLVYTLDDDASGAERAS